jgi:membrane associated rhomboid family serine protease
MSTEPSLPSPPALEHCYRHPSEQTGVHCTRCGRPICPACMIEAPVGYQCPECVGEARREFRRGPGRRIAVANARGTSLTTLLLVAIGLMYAIEVIPAGPGALFAGPSLLRLVRLGGNVGYGIDAGSEVGVAAGQYWRLFTSMFLHANLVHIALNAYALFLFGHVIEQELGRVRFALIYLTTGLFASAVSYAFAQPGQVGIGASGAIFGLFGAFFAYNYRRRHQALAAARIQQMVFLLVINLVLGLSIPGIDWHAHAGGFVAGLAAGAIAEGWGDEAHRRVIMIAGFLGIVAVTAVVVAWRTADLLG